MFIDVTLKEKVLKALKIEAPRRLRGAKNKQPTVPEMGRGARGEASVTAGDAHPGRPLCL